MGGNKAKNIGKGGRLVTENICETCYSFKNVLSDYEIKRSLNIGENNPLLICRDQFNSDIKKKPWEDSVTHKKGRDKGRKKKRKLQVYVQRSNKKARKQSRNSK